MNSDTLHYILHDKLDNKLLEIIVFGGVVDCPTQLKLLKVEFEYSNVQFDSSIKVCKIIQVFAHRYL